MNRIFTSLLALGAITLGTSAATWTDVANESQLTAAIADNAEAIRFTADFTCAYSGYYKVYSDLQIDLNGHRITFTDRGFAILNYAEVVVDDLSASGGGEMTSESGSLFFINTLSPFTIRGGTYRAGGFDSYCIDIYKNREVTMEGGRINASRYGRAVSNKGYFTMRGGTIVGADHGFEPVLNDIEGVFTMLDGAVYAGNMTPSVCFENTYWTNGVEEEIAVTVLPEGVTDGGAVVLSEQWAIPGTYYINYHFVDGMQCQPNMTHYYTGDEDVALPECNYRDNIAFAGWSASEDDTSEVFTEIKAGEGRNYQLYPVWRYVDLAPEVSPDLLPESVTPDPSETLTELSSIVLSFGEGDYYINDYAENMGALYNLKTGAMVCEVVSIDTDWDGNATVTLSETVAANGTYELRIPVNTIGNDDWYYSDMEEGRCNPDLFFRFKVYNTPQGDTNCVTDPENGETVLQLSVIRFLFPDEEDVLKNYDVTALLTNESGETVAEVSAFDMDYDDEASNVIILTLPEPVTANGVYTLSVPVGFFQFDWWERDCSAMTFTWTVSDNGGCVELTATSADAGTVIYDLSGRRVDSNDPASLAPGIYIVNGKKIAIR